MNAQAVTRHLAAIGKARRESDAVLCRLRSATFDKQRSFIDDPSRLKAAICSRRAGKSTCGALYLLETALQHAGSVSLYIALTRDTAKRILWDELKRANDRYACGIDSRCFSEVELAVRLTNGSVIYLLGIDSNAKEKEKLLGQKYKLVIVDEAASFRIDLRQLVYEVVKPATADLAGVIALTGTPGDFIGPTHNRHLFYSVTTGDEPGWSVHRWGTADNPHMRTQWADELEEIKLRNPLFLDSPDYRRMYLGEWAVDSSRLVYHYSASLNGIEQAPKLDRYVIGCDLGWADATSFVVVGWRQYDTTLYVAQAFKRSHMTLTDVAAELRVLQTAYPKATIVVDGAAKQAVEELRQREKLQLQTAEKSGKADFIRLLNSDLATGKIRVATSQCLPLLDEWSALLWDDRASIPKELDACENHCSDAALYAWRWSRNYTAQQAPQKRIVTDEQVVDSVWRAYEKELSDDS